MRVSAKDLVHQLHSKVGTPTTIPCCSPSQLALQRQSLPRLPGVSKRTRHLTNAVIGCCLLLTHVTSPARSAPAPASLVRSCGRVRALLPSLRLQSCAGCCCLSSAMQTPATRWQCRAARLTRLWPRQTGFAWQKFAVFQQMRPGFEPSRAGRRQGVGWGWGTRGCPGRFGAISKGVHLLSRVWRNTLGDLSQMQSLLMSSRSVWFGFGFRDRTPSIDFRGAEEH